MQVVSNSQTAQPRWRRPGFLNQRHDNPPSRGTDIHLHSATALIRCEREPRIRLTEQSRHAPMATHPRTDLTQAPCTEGVSRHVAAIGAIATNALVATCRAAKTPRQHGRRYTFASHAHRRLLEATDDYAALLSVDWLLLCLSNAFLYSGTLCHIAAACPFNGLSRLGSASKLWIESRIVRTL